MAAVAGGERPQRQNTVETESHFVDKSRCLESSFFLFFILLYPLASLYRTDLISVFIVGLLCDLRSETISMSV